MTNAILFDLGNTLVKYYQIDEFEPILRKSVDRVLEELESRKIHTVSGELAMNMALEENREAQDFQFSPMENRLERIFDLSLVGEAELRTTLCEEFLGPIFEVGIVYTDTIPVLKQLRSRGFKLGIVSNAPWGSPADIWRNELKRLGLAELVESITMCGDVGWRKPASQIFEFASKSIGEPCENCTFVGDEIAWDIEGSSSVGMRPILIDRYSRFSQYDGLRVTNMNALLELVGT